MALTHSPRCVEQTEAHQAYMRKWPKACQNCGAGGVIAYPATRDDPGGADPCPECVEQGRCPRCGASQPEDFSGDACAACGWLYDDSLDGAPPTRLDDPMYMPHGDCLCAFEVVCPTCAGKGEVTYQPESGDASYPVACPDCEGTGACWVDGPIDLPLRQPEMWAVIGDIIYERHRQDVKYGGPAHDDIHDPMRWWELLNERMDKMAPMVHLAMEQPTYREELVKLAAMVVAAIQTLDRQQAREKGAAK